MLQKFILVLFLLCVFQVQASDTFYCHSENTSAYQKIYVYEVQLDEQLMQVQVNSLFYYPKGAKKLAFLLDGDLSNTPDRAHFEYSNTDYRVEFFFTKVDVVTNGFKSKLNVYFDEGKLTYNCTPGPKSSLGLSL